MIEIYDEMLRGNLESPGDRWRLAGIWNGPVSSFLLGGSWKPDFCGKEGMIRVLLLYYPILVSTTLSKIRVLLLLSIILVSSSYYFI